MNAILMAGGEGKRLRPIWPDAPKPMIPVLGRPAAERALALLRRSGVSRVRLTLGYKPDVIRDYFGDGRDFGLELSYSIEEAPLGTAGGVRACARFYGDRDFLVLSGDAVCDFDLRALTEYHRRMGAALTMALREVETPTAYGLIVADDRGRVRGFVEKPDWTRVVTDRVNTGVYAVSPRAMALVPLDAPFDFAKDLIPLLLERGETVAALPMAGYWCDIGTPRAYYQCNLDALDGRVKLFEGPDAHPAAAQLPPEPEAAPVTNPPGPDAVVVPCASCARLMRLLTERCLTEAGADFSDGLTLPGAHVAPDPAAEAVVVTGGDEKARNRLAALAGELNDTV